MVTWVVAIDPPGVRFPLNAIDFLLESLFIFEYSISRLGTSMGPAPGPWPLGLGPEQKHNDGRTFVLQYENQSQVPPKNNFCGTEPQPCSAVLVHTPPRVMAHGLL